MKLNERKNLQSLFLACLLSISLFVGGCSIPTQDLNTPSTNSTTQNNNDFSTSTNNSTNISNNTDIPNNAVQANVERVVDGDTVKVKLKDSGEVVTLRLLLIDTPESVKPGVDPQPYSKEASNFAKKVLEAGDTVYIEYDNGDKTDKYNRHLCYLWYYSKKDNQWKMYNEIVVENGLARVGYVYSQKRHLQTLYAAQDKAKKNKLNIWSVDGYVTDRGYDVEAYNYNKNTSSPKNEIVYVNGGVSKSSKYHSSKTAHGMKGAIEMTKSKAKSEGYEPCRLCYPQK